MSPLEMTDDDIRIRGFEALIRELGPAGAIRFLHLFDSGSGDYSKERHRWLDDKTVAELAEQLKKQ